MSQTTPVRVPNLGTEASSARVSAWLRRPGDTVAAGEIVAELETDKATVELEAPVAGVLRDIVVPEGAEAAVGAMLGLIEHD